jgi:hypothetical protein
MTVIAIEHVQLAMPPGREGEAHAFYAGLLGIPEVPKPAHLAARGGAWFEAGEVKVHLGVEEDFRPARKAHPAFVATGLEELVARCARQGTRSWRMSRSQAGSGSTPRTRSATGSNLWRVPPHELRSPHHSHVPFPGRKSPSENEVSRFMHLRAPERGAEWW